MNGPLAGIMGQATTKVSRFYYRARIASEGFGLNFRAMVSGRRRAMLHGLQRSGTNYLLLWLHWNGVAVINHRDPPSHHPRHKHFRCQWDKFTLIPPVRVDYDNQLKVSDLDQLDATWELTGEPIHSVLYGKVAVVGLHGELGPECRLVS